MSSVSVLQESKSLLFDAMAVYWWVRAKRKRACQNLTKVVSFVFFVSLDDWVNGDNLFYVNLHDKG